MIGRLFRHDLRALSRSLLPIHAVIVIVVFAGMLFMGWWYYYSDNPSEYPTELYNLFSLMYGVILSLCEFACVAGPVSTFIVGIIRFYTNLFTDEGQLTLTLPLSATQILLSKVLAALLWVFIDVVVLMLCSVLLFFGISGFGSIAGILDGLAYFFGCIGSLTMGSFADGFLGNLITGSYAEFSYQLLGFIHVLVSIMSNMLLAFFAFTLGAATANRHRVAAGIAWYIGLFWLVVFAISLVDFILASCFAQNSTMFFLAIWENIFTAALLTTCLVMVVSFVLTAYVLARKVDAKG